MKDIDKVKAAIEHLQQVLKASGMTKSFAVQIWPVTGPVCQEGVQITYDAPALYHEDAATGFGLTVDEALLQLSSAAKDELLRADELRALTSG